MSHASGREIIAQIVDNMRGQTEELRYSRVVSSSYNVHLHPDDYARLEGLIPEIVAQACRALGEELDRLNRSRPFEERIRRWVRQPRVPYERAAPEWIVRVLADPNEELEPGDILVDATLAVPRADRFSGNHTQRIVTRRRGDHVERRVVAAEAPADAPPEPAATTATAPAPALATLRWRDERGEHVFRMTAPVIKVGRGGQAYWVDVRLDTVADVSREHFRIRWDEGARHFLIQDLSTFGTSVDGRPLPAPPPGEPAGEAAEVALPRQASIGLAGALTIRFESELPA